jgi:hypothetical protein
MIANVRPWTVASPEDHHYADYMGDRTMLYDVLPISDGAYTLLTKIFSSRPECRPSLAAIREEVLAMDTFFVSDGEAARWGWKGRVEKKLQQKMMGGKIGTCSARPRCSEETSSGSFYSGTSSSSASFYSDGSSSSAFESISLRSSPLPITPPVKAVEVFRTIEKVPGRLELGLHVAAAQLI